MIFNLACAASPEHYQADPVHTLMTSVVGSADLLALATERRAADAAGVDQRNLWRPYRIRSVKAISAREPDRAACVGPATTKASARPRRCRFDYLRAGLADVRVARIFNTYGPRMRPDDGR